MARSQMKGKQNIKKQKTKNKIQETKKDKEG
jgi:hypothetical protein